MYKKYYYAKEITCPECEGNGVLKWGEEPSINDELNELGEIICDRCQGKGYITDMVDKQTGFTIIQMNGECK